MTASDKPYLLLISAIIAICCILWGSNGVRGTDQYWYLSDVESLVDKQPPVTNIYYAGNLLRQSTEALSPNYFMHNGPVLHLTAAIGKFSGAYSAWIIINIICHLLVATTIYLISAHYTSTRTAISTTCLYLLSPIAIWQTINLLQESFYSGLLAAVFLSYHYRHNFIAQISLSIVLCVGISSHPIFFILALLYSSYLLFEGVGYRQNSRIYLGCIIALLYILTRYYSKDVFPSSFQPDLKSIVAGSVPGKSNMLFHYTLDLPEINLALLIGKAKEAMHAHLLVLKNAPFYLYTNIAILALPYLFFKRLRNYAVILLPCALTLGLYLSILVLMQTQARYQQIVAPATFIIIALVIHEILTQKYTTEKFCCTYIIIPLLCVSSVTDFYLANTAHKQSITQAEDSLSIRNIFSSMPPESKIVSYDNPIEVDLRLSYFAKPRHLLAIKTKYLTLAETKTVLERFRSDYMISSIPIPDNKTPFELIGKQTVSSLGDLYIFGNRDKYYGEGKSQP